MSALALVFGCSSEGARDALPVPAGGGGAAGGDVQGTAGNVSRPIDPGSGAGFGGAAGGGGGASDAGAAGRSGAPAELVPVFVAQGHLGRITVSCDGGRSWLKNSSRDDNARCFENGLDCDHHAWTARGIAYGAGVFAITWGWGAPGTQQRSRSAVEWETTATEAPTFADIAFGAGRFVAGGDPTRVSLDGGGWQIGGPLQLDMNYRSIDFIDHDGGRYIVTGESGDRHTIVHSPDGVTWTSAAELPRGCGSGYRGIAYGANTAVFASGNGHICHSQNGGRSWVLVDLPAESLSSPPIWTGQEFLVWSGSTVYSSNNGVDWSSQRVSPETVNIGPVAIGADGTLVAVNAGWKVWYDQQHFYRSVDGRSWEVLGRDRFVGSHPIQFIASGYVSGSEACADQ